MSRQRLTLPAAVGFWANTKGEAPLLALPQELERMGLVQTLVFDRKRWNPEMFLALQRRGAACVTWITGEQAARCPDSEFAPTAIPLRLALGIETGPGQPSGRNGQTRKARQPALLTTHPILPTAEMAGLLGSRWAQKTAFKTLCQEFGLDSMPHHAAQEMEAARPVANPAMRRIKKELYKDRRADVPAAPTLC